MARRLFTLASAVSLVLCGFVLVAGAVGFREESDLSLDWWVGDHRLVHFVSDRGMLGVVYSTGWPSPEYVINGRKMGSPAPLTFRHGIVADVFDAQNFLTDGRNLATIRYWGFRTNILYAVAFALLPPSGWAFARLHSRLLVSRRHAAGLCSSCGYDLRATPDRCPECGKWAGKERGP